MTMECLFCRAEIDFDKDSSLNLYKEFYWTCPQCGGTFEIEYNWKEPPEEK